MSDLLQLLASGSQYVETGFVEQYLGDDRYRVNMAGVRRIVRSGVNEKLATGMRVIINQTAHGRYVIGTTHRLQTRAENEIVVKG